MKKDIIHVYFGSQGSGGLYTDEIYTSLNHLGFNQEVIVSYYYPFNYGKKIFFRFTDLVSGIKKSKFRLYFRAVELVIGLLYSYLYIAFTRPKLVNYSLNPSYLTDVLFVTLLKKTTNSKLVVTCHDIIPMAENQNSIDRQISNRKKIFKLADYLLVHNTNSIEDLEIYFNVPAEKIIIHPFPIMDLSKMPRNFGQSFEKTYDFTFLGHLRENKGVDILIEAWKIVHDRFPLATLLLAGNCPDESKFDLVNYEQLNITMRLHYLSDNDYFRYAQQSRNVVLPYRSGTNSGVIYNLIPMGMSIIFSDLPMFMTNSLLDKSGAFRSSNPMSLADKICEFHMADNSKGNINLEKYKDDFNRSLSAVYKRLLQDG